MLRIDYMPRLRVDYMQPGGLIWNDEGRENMPKNALLFYSEELASQCELLCKSIKGNANAVSQLRRSSSSVLANVSEGQYPHSLSDMLFKFRIARKECVETESWLKLLYNTHLIDEPCFKAMRNLAGRVERLITASCLTIEKKPK